MADDKKPPVDRKQGGDKKPAKGKMRADTGLKVHVKTARGRTASSVRWLERQLNDPYVIKAKKEGWRSRAAFKLIEIDEKFRLLKSGYRVVDLGAAPGGWCQVAAKKVGSAPGNPLIVGIDYLEMDGIPGVTLFQKDFLDDDAPAGRRLRRQGGPRRHRERASRHAEAPLRRSAPLQAAVEPAGERRDVRRRQGLQGASRRQRRRGRRRGMTGRTPEGKVKPLAPARLVTRLRRSALAYLNRYAASRAHFASVLTRKLGRWADLGLFDPEMVDAARLVADVVEEFEGFGLLDDARFAEARAASLRRKGGSRRKIALGLRAKGVDAETAGAAIAASDVDEMAAALNLCRRRRIGPWRRDGKAADADSFRREAGILVRQGFGYGLARAALLMDVETAESRRAGSGEVEDGDAMDG
jgi:23S rRNA U2552 (ribose-2'-O)-methylase RlmE/FtsJ